MLGVKNQFAIIILFLVLALLSQSVKVIPEGRTGVIFNLKGGVQDNALGEGVHFLIPFMQSLVVFDTRVLTYAFSDSVDGEMKLGDLLVAKTQDGQVVKIETSIVTQMIKARAPEVYQKLRADYEPVLKSKTSKIFQEVIARHVADALYTEETRKAVSQEVFKNLSDSFLASGFELKDVLVRRIEFSPEYIEAIENKQIAFQKAQLAQIRKEIAMKEKQIEIIRGEGIAREVEIKGQAIQMNPRVAELEYLDVLEQSGTKVPVIMGLKGNALIDLGKLLPVKGTP